MVRTSDLRLLVAVSILSHDTAGYFSDRCPSFMHKLSWDITINSVLHLSGVAKSSTSFGWGIGVKAGKSLLAGGR